MDSFLFPRIHHLVGYKNSYYYYYTYNGWHRYNYNRYYTGTNIWYGRSLFQDCSSLDGDGTGYYQSDTAMPGMADYLDPHYADTIPNAVDIEQHIVLGLKR